MSAVLGGGTPEGLEWLLDRVAEGDEESMGRLFDAVAPWLTVLMGRLVGVADSDEVLRRTFVEVWRAAPAADRQHGVMGWITGIAIGHARQLRVAS